MTPHPLMMIHHTTRGCTLDPRRIYELHSLHTRTPCRASQTILPAMHLAAHPLTWSAWCGNRTLPAVEVRAPHCKRDITTRELKFSCHTFCVRYKTAGHVLVIRTFVHNFNSFFHGFYVKVGSMQLPRMTCMGLFWVG